MPAAGAKAASAASQVLMHRCRFVDHVPEAVESLQYDPSCSRLAVLRANGDIELWSLTAGGWWREAHMPGVPETPVRRLVLGERTAAHPDGRLFSCGLHGLVTEWDVAHLSPLESYDSMGGAAWGLALHDRSSRLAVGTEDGGVTLFLLTDDSLDLSSRLPARGSRVLAVSFSRSGSHLVAGGADGAVRVWALGGSAAPRPMCHFVLESDGRRKPPLAWDVLFLHDMCIVTADSSGRVCFYDGRHGTIVNRFRSHEADVLSLAATADGSHVFASGADHKVALFTPAPEELHTPGLAVFNLAAPRSPRSWLLACSRRPHTHDVRALCVVEPPPGLAGPPPSADTGGGSAPASASWISPQLVSAGLDTQLCFMMLDGFERVPPTKLLPPPLPSACSLAPGARLLMAHESSEVRVWNLNAADAAAAAPPPAAAATATAGAAGASGGVAAAGPGVDASRPAVDTSHDASLTEPRQLLLLKPSGMQRHLFTAVLSPNGAWLAASDSEPRIYRLQLTGQAGAPPVRRVALPAGTLPAACAAFTADSQLLVLGGTGGGLQAVPLDAEASQAASVHTLRPPPGPLSAHPDAPEEAGPAGGPPAVLRVCVSLDGQWAAAADARRRVSVYSLDALAFHASMPPLPSPPTAIAFLPGTSLLAVATVDKRLLFFDADAGRTVHTAAAGGGLPILALRGKPEPILRIAFDPASPGATLLCAQTWALRIDLGSLLISRPGAAAHVKPAVSLPEAAAGGVEEDGGGAGVGTRRRRRKRKRSSARAAAGEGPGAGRDTAGGGAPETAGGGKLVTKYGPMLLLDFLAAEVAVVVEQPWLRVMERLPDAMYRHQFGT